MACFAIGGSGEKWPDSSYTPLAALKRANNTAYFNTGVVVDSTARFRVRFYNSDSNDSTWWAVCGIRRASGNGDTKRIAPYIRTSSIVNGLAINYDGVDTGQIDGGAVATKFGGQEIEISVNSGKWYNWDRLVYESSAEFNNPDNVPVFLGCLAKNATTIYGTVSFYHNFTEAVFYDANGNMTHRFLPYKNSSNQLGFWDTIEGTFSLVNNQSAWTAVTTHTYRSMRMHSRFYNIRNSGSYQSATEVKGWQIAVQDEQRYFVLTNEKYELRENVMNNAGRVLEAAVYDANWHGNTCWFGSEYADEDDYFPLLYVGTDKDNHLLTVYRLVGSNPATCTIELVQKIYTPEGDSVYGSTLYYHNYYGKAGCNTFIQAAWTKNSYSSNTGEYAGNVYMYRIFPLPSLGDGSEVTITEADMLGRGDIGFISTGQNGGWNGKYWIIGTVRYLLAYEITAGGATLQKSIDHQTTGSADYYATEECEGFSWNEEGGYFVALWNPTYGLSLDAYMDDYKLYAENVYEFGV